MKYVLVTGGVVSGLGKGITSSSIGVCLKACGLHVTHIKIDPYLNTDAGTMSPYEHGEVYVLDDGGEVDLDLGNYERFAQITLTKDHNITTGKIYSQVINRERKGDYYLGKTVQVVPHITDAIQEWIERVAQLPVEGNGIVPDVCIIELGGTVGDMESMIFLEALRQFRYRVGGDNLCHVHVSLLPHVGHGEPKSKPTQHSIRELRAAGLNPDLIVCRSSKPMDRGSISKISLFCMVPATHVISVYDVSNTYKVPGLLLEARVPGLVLGALKINRMPPDSLPGWARIAHRCDNSPQEVRIGFVGKYTALQDAYLSVTKALSHAGFEWDVKVLIEWIEASDLEEENKHKEPEVYNEAWKKLKSVDGILCPGGFGDRGVNGKVAAVQFARENKIPFLGICLGMQVAVIEYARHVLEKKDANSAEFDEETPDPVVIFMPEGSTTHKGGTMRLGSRVSILQEDTLAFQLYGGQKEVYERHRHRYEVNPQYVEQLEKAGLLFSSRDDTECRMEMLELHQDTHPFFFALQSHPEFKSSPFHPSPPFRGFIGAAAGKFVRQNIKPVKPKVAKERKMDGPEHVDVFPSSESSLPSVLSPSFSSLSLQNGEITAPVSKPAALSAHTPSSIAPASNAAPIASQ